MPKENVQTKELDLVETYMVLETTLGDRPYTDEDLGMIGETITTARDKFAGIPKNEKGEKLPDRWHGFLRHAVQITEIHEAPADIARELQQYIESK